MSVDVAGNSRPKLRVAILSLFMLALITLNSIHIAKPVQAKDLGSIAPSQNWGIFFDTNGDIQININDTGIAVRIDVPREFLTKLVSENDTSFVETDITNDYYYISVLDQAKRWSYRPEAPCSISNHSMYDPNAPWCVEIWSVFNTTYRFFAPPKFVKLTGLSAPSIAGLYNFTLYVATSTLPCSLPCTIPYPDFYKAKKQVLRVPVSMREDPSRIFGNILDDEAIPDLIIKTKGVVYAIETTTGFIGRAFVNATTGFYNITGLYAGTYRLQASAGYFPVTGFAYSLTEFTFVGVGKAYAVRQDLRLKRAPKILGNIEYQNSTSRNPILSITQNAWLRITGVRALEYRVEARDSSGRIYRNITLSRNATTDSYAIITGNWTRFVGYPSYGTEFAGLPPAPETYTLTVYVYGYLQRDTLTVSIAPNQRSITQKIIVLTGGVITGTIKLLDPFGLGLETPRQSEIRGLQTIAATGLFFGGNILVQAYDAQGALRGLVVYNGTRKNGLVTFIDSSTIRFYILGFSELLNQTYSGIWFKRDSGLGTVGTLSENFEIRVFLRGYVQLQAPTVFLPFGGNTTLGVDVYRGGVINVTIASYNSKFGTLVAQSIQPFILFNQSIPVFIRVYFYDSAGSILGFVEKRLRGGEAGVTATTVRVTFTGMNWNLRDIIYFGLVPNALPAGTYTIRAFTVGYIQTVDSSTILELGSLQQVALILLIANAIEATVVLRAQPILFTSLTERVFARGEVYDAMGTLRGVKLGNFSAGTTTFVFPIFGLNGTGHFFYESPDGTKYFDYGIPPGLYTVRVPEFGYDRHFIQFTTATPQNFPALGLQAGVVFSVIRMGKIWQGSALVRGFTFLGQVIALSWVKVDVVTGSTATRDGFYALHVPNGIYAVQFSIPGYVTFTSSNIIVNWSDIIPVTPEPPLVESGAPFPGVALSIRASPKSTPTGILYVLSASVSGASNAGQVSYSWSTGGGTLNATSGKAVLWTPPTASNQVSYTIVCTAKIGAARQVSGSVTLNANQIPEFPSVTVISASSILIFVILVHRKKKTDAHVPLIRRRCFVGTKLSPPGGTHHARVHETLADHARGVLGGWRAGRNPPSVLGDICLIGIPAPPAGVKGAYYPFHSVG